MAQQLAQKHAWWAWWLCTRSCINIVEVVYSFGGVKQRGRFKKHYDTGAFSTLKLRVALLWPCIFTAFGGCNFVQQQLSSSDVKAERYLQIYNDTGAFFILKQLVALH